jgi:hypothetical protein
VTAVVAAALLVLGFGAVVLSRMRDGEFLTPGSAFAASWLASCGLYLLRILPYPPMPSGAAAVLVLGVISLLIGIHVGRRWIRWRRPLVQPVVWSPWWTTMYGCAGLAGVAWYVWDVDRYVGLSTFGHGFELRSALTTHRIPSDFLFLEFFCVITPIVAAAAAVTGHRLRAWHWWLVAGCVAGTWISTDRTQFFTIVLTAASMFVYRRGPALDWKRLGGVVLVCAALLLSNFVAVNAWRWPGNERQRRSSVQPGAPATQATPGEGGRGLLRHGETIYLYTTGSFAAFAAWYPLEHPRTYGLHAGFPVMRALQRAGFYRGDLPAHIAPFVPIVEREPQPIWWNGYTFLYYPLLDFGLPGMVLYCLAVGAFSGAAHESVRRGRDRPDRLLLAAQVTVALVLSIFVNKFNNTGWWYVLLCSLAPFTISRWIGDLRRYLSDQSRPVTN